LHAGVSRRGNDLDGQVRRCRHRARRLWRLMPAHWWVDFAHFFSDSCRACCGNRRRQNNVCAQFSDAMKAAAPVLSAPAAIPASQVARKSIAALLCDLFKARLTFLVLLTTLVGFYLGSPGAPAYSLMIHTVLATALLASGAAALNQLLEREHDAKMRRTQS